MTPTEEQTAIISAATGSNENVMLNAYAGCGKTSTLLMIERAVKARPILYLVFNKKNAEDATYDPDADDEAAAKRMLSTTTVRTFNSIGHRIWSQACAKNQMKLNPKKTADLLRELIKAAPRQAQGPIWDCFWDVVNGVARAKALGYVPEGKYPNAKRLIGRSAFHATLDEEPDDLIADLIDSILTTSIKLAYDGTIDYNDQIYMPALFGGTCPQFPLVLVDEYQDLNPVNHTLLAKLAKKRLIGVGDPYQSIYAFRGAKAQGMAEATAIYSMRNLDLSVSFRCPSAIVSHVLWHVPNFKWIKEGGNVSKPTHLMPNTIPDDGTIICRNNAPILGMALRLLANGRSVSVAGSDIGPKLIALMKKLGSDEMNRAQTLSAIRDWEDEKLSKDSTTASDLAACMRVFAEQGDSLAQAIRYAEHVLSQKGSIGLMTGHKAKGLEFDYVIHLDPYLVRHGYRGAEPSDQDKNLDYVISTRSKNQLTEIASQAIKW